MRNSILFVFILFFGCSSELTIPITGTWRCEKVDRIERPDGQSMATSLGQEMAISEKVSDTLILKPDDTYDEFVSVFGIGNHINGTYIFSPSDRNLQLTKNADAPGLERIKNFTISKLSTDTLIVNDNIGFTFIYVRLKTK